MTRVRFPRITRLPLVERGSQPLLVAPGNQKSIIVICMLNFAQPNTSQTITKTSSIAPCHRIVYDRSFMLHLRNSPLSQTPPKNMHFVDGIVKADANVEVVKSSPGKGEINLTVHTGFRIPKIMRFCM